MSKQNFYEKMLPYAQQASQALNMPVSAILTQWALESGYGTSRFAIEGLNFGGIKLSKNSPTSDYLIQGGSGAKFAKYSSLSQFTEDYIRVMNLSYYNHVRGLQDPIETLKALANSPYDAGGYSNNKLINWFYRDDVAQYDSSNYYIKPRLDGNNLNIPLPGLEPDTIALVLISLAVMVLVGGVSRAFRS